LKFGKAKTVRKVWVLSQRAEGRLGLRLWLIKIGLIAINNIKNSKVNPTNKRSFCFKWEIGE
jgi:hypothetical protein